MESKVFAVAEEDHRASRVRKDVRFPSDLEGLAILQENKLRQFLLYEIGGDHPVAGRAEEKIIERAGVHAVAREWQHSASRGEFNPGESLTLETKEFGFAHFEQYRCCLRVKVNGPRYDADTDAKRLEYSHDGFFF
jgi:hypothetical protein